MAYLLLVIGLTYTLAWGAGLVFSARSSGQKNPVVPAVALIGFIGVSVVAAQASMAAMQNPPRLTAEAFFSLQEGMSPDDVKGVLGLADINPERGSYGLTGRGVSIPSEVAGRLSPGENSAEDVDAKLVITIVGEPSRRKAREGLGALATDEKDGLLDLQIVLTENSNESSFIEGEHWTYENDDTAEQVAKKIADAISAHPSWNAEGSTEEAPKKIMVTAALDGNQGERGNQMKGRVATGPNGAVRVGYRDDGKWVQFRGGQDSVLLQYWSEPDIALDGDFTMTNRLILIGYVDDKIAEGGIRQAGLNLPPQLAAAP